MFLSTTPVAPIAIGTTSTFFFYLFIYLFIYFWYLKALKIRECKYGRALRPFWEMGKY